MRSSYEPTTGPRDNFAKYAVTKLAALIRYLILDKRERAPLNHAHMLAPHCLCSSGVNQRLHTIDLTDEI